MRRIANRTAECAVFEKLLAGEIEARILLLEGTGERGKSTLLAEFGRRARVQWGTEGCAVFELKQGVPLRQVFHAICRQLGAGVCPRYSEVNRSQGAPITIRADLAGAQIGDSNEISVGSNITLQESDKVAKLAEALVEDLSVRDSPALLVIDTYEQATPECARWLVEVLLPAVANNSRLFCVVAGRSVPDCSQNQLTWGNQAQLHKLEKDISLDDWAEYRS